MKAKPFKRTPVPSLAGRSATDLLRRREVVALVASRISAGKYDDERTLRNAVSANVYDAVNAGTLRQVAPDSFQLGEVSRWARVKWPAGRFADLPCTPALGAMQGRLIGRYEFTGAGYVCPQTLQRAIADALELRQEKVALVSALAKAEQRVIELEPDAMRWRQWIDKKKRNNPRVAANAQICGVDSLRRVCTGEWEAIGRERSRPLPRRLP